MTQPLISVYMPTHNRLELLKRAIASVRQQTWQNWELVVTNDGSSDGTKDYLNQLASEDTRIRAIHHDTPKGACVSRNAAIEAANGEFITGLDDDDEFLPERLEALYKAYDDNYAFVCAGYYWCTADKQKPVMCTDKVISLQDQLHANEATNQVLVKKERMSAIGGFDPEFVALQDYDCFTRLIEQFGSAKRIGKPLLYIHVEHGGARISNTQKNDKGFAQFMARHGQHMTAKHKVNHEFWRKMRSREPFSLVELLKSLPAGYPLKKIKHFLLVR